jgi:hypothetical protein
MTEGNNESRCAQLTQELLDRLRLRLSARHPSGAGASAAPRRAVDSPRIDALRSHAEQRQPQWHGGVQIKGAITRGGKVLWVEDNGAAPEFYRLYAQTQDHTLQWLSDYPTAQQAQEHAQKLTALFRALNEN